MSPLALARFCVAIGLCTVGSQPSQYPTNGSRKEYNVVMDDNRTVILNIFRAIEQRDEPRVRELFATDLEMHWPIPLPYGGTYKACAPGRTTWSATWAPLQPTDTERRMDARVIAAAADDVVVLWHQRGVSPGGERFDGEVLGLYKLQNGRLSRAQMFYFDEAAAAGFLARAKLETEKK